MLYMIIIFITMKLQYWFMLALTLNDILSLCRKYLTGYLHKWTLAHIVYKVYSADSLTWTAYSYACLFGPLKQSTNRPIDQLSSWRVDHLPLLRITLPLHNAIVLYECVKKDQRSNKVLFRVLTPIVLCHISRKLCVNLFTMFIVTTIRIHMCTQRR